MLNRKITTFFIFSIFSAIIAAPQTEKPNIATCAQRNFPAEAKPFVTKAMVLVKILVDKKGLVREVKTLKVDLLEITDAKVAESTIPLFEKAGVDSLLNQTCPIYYHEGQPTPYRMEIPLLYELID